jgi:hypothetical protein
MSAAFDLLTRTPARSVLLRPAGRAGNVSAWTFGDLPGPMLLEARRFADARGVFAET